MIKMDTLPFFFIETSLTNEVIKMNEHLLADMKTSVLNKSVTELFDVWDTKQGGNLIQARLKDQSYIFIKEQVDK